VLVIVHFIISLVCLKFFSSSGFQFHLVCSQALPLRDNKIHGAISPQCPKKFPHFATSHGLPPCLFLDNWPCKVYGLVLTPSFPPLTSYLFLFTFYISPSPFTFIIYIFNFISSSWTNLSISSRSSMSSSFPTRRLFKASNCCRSRYSSQDEGIYWTSQKQNSLFQGASLIMTSNSFLHSLQRTVVVPDAIPQSSLPDTSAEYRHLGHVNL
jgi:hypothetical protein